MKDLFDSKCKEKLSFENIEEAQGAAVTADWRYGKTKDAKLKPYLCPKCGLFHLSTEYADNDDKDEV